MVPAALASGLILMATAFLLFCARYLIFFQRLVVELGMQILNSPESNVPVYGVGIVASGEYMTQPTTWLLIFATIDGAFRFLAALSVGEVVPTLPLYPVVWIHGRLDAWAAEKKLGPIVLDRVQAVERKAYDVLVGASRKKSGWDTHITIRYQDELYEILKQVDGRPPDRFLYELRKSPVWRVTRKIQDYDPSGTPPEEADT